MSLRYIPAVLKELKTRWYIEYYQYHPIINKKVRFRETYDLNRIKDLKLRRTKANHVINQINERLPFGWPYEDLNRLQPDVNIKDATYIALDIKLKNCKSRDTINTYNSMVDIFVKWLQSIKLDKMPVNAFSRVHCLEYLDHIYSEKNLCAVTYNNYVNTLKSIFYTLVDRQYILENPFARLPKKKVGSKRRRALSKYERSILANYIKDNNKFLHLAILLQYHCFIRPKELRFLKPYMFDFKNGLIRIPGEITKNEDDSLITIPNSIIDLLQQTIGPITPNAYIFGSKLKPRIDKPCSKNYMNSLHRKYLHELKSKGQLDHIEGLVFYSWKDTGGMALVIAGVNIIEIMRQMRHKDLSYTQRYVQSLYMVNKEIKVLDNAI